MLHRAHHQRPHLEFDKSVGHNFGAESLDGTFLSLGIVEAPDTLHTGPHGLGVGEGPHLAHELIPRREVGLGADRGTVEVNVAFGMFYGQAYR